MYLLYAIAGSIILHIMICYIPLFEGIFNTVPLDMYDWYKIMNYKPRILIIGVSAPVIIVDEILKMISRSVTKKSLDLRRKQ